MRGYKKSTVPMPPAANEEVCHDNVGDETRGSRAGRTLVNGGGKRSSDVSVLYYKRYSWTFLFDVRHASFLRYSEPRVFHK